MARPYKYLSHMHGGVKDTGLFGKHVERRDTCEMRFFRRCGSKTLSSPGLYAVLLGESLTDVHLQGQAMDKM
jgi:hypothetical protein